LAHLPEKEKEEVQEFSSGLGFSQYPKKRLLMK